VVVAVLFAPPGSERRDGLELAGVGFLLALAFLGDAGGGTAHYLRDVGSVGFFLFVPLRFATERRRQMVDPAHGLIVSEVHSAIHHSETRYLSEEFTSLEYRRRIPVLTGKRDLPLIDFSQAELVAIRLGLPITGKP
jgi:hypothetical protein